MTTANDHEQMQLRLGLYALGALPDDECLLVDEHLAICDECPAIVAELGDVRAVLDRLSPEDLASLADEFSPARHTDAAPPTLPRQTPRQQDLPQQDLPPHDPRPQELLAHDPSPQDPPPLVPLAQDLPHPDPAPGADPAGPPPAAEVHEPARPNRRRGPVPQSRRPRGGRPGGRPDQHPAGAASAPLGNLRSRTVRLVSSLLAAALVLSVGVGVWLMTNQGSVAVALTGSDTSTATGVSISVTAVARDGRSHVEARVSGLTQGREYQLLAVDVRAQTLPVARWLSSSTDTVTADIAVPIEDLAFFSVVETGGPVVVTVRVTRTE